jgi:hypothetical protein
MSHWRSVGTGYGEGNSSQIGVIDTIIGIVCEAIQTCIAESGCVHEGAA